MRIKKVLEDGPFLFSLLGRSEDPCGILARLPEEQVSNTLHGRHCTRSSVAVWVLFIASPVLLLEYISNANFTQIDAQQHSSAHIAFGMLCI
jgi:hypothetical protein